MPESTNSGFLFIDKPVDWTSHDVVAKLRGITKTKTVGHAGTLDPFATGLLIVGVGRTATKHLSRFLKADKMYEATARFDGVSDTDDVTGHITPYTKDPQSQIPSPLIIKDAFASQVGDILQTPPAYSAKKIDGQKMYVLARAGKTVAPKAVAVQVYTIDITAINWPEVSFTVRASSGTYIRAIARDVGSVLGTGGYLTTLRRTAIAEHTIDAAVPIDHLTPQNWHTFLWNFPTPS